VVRAHAHFAFDTGAEIASGIDAVSGSHLACKNAHPGARGQAPKLHPNLMPFGHLIWSSRGRLQMHICGPANAHLQQPLQYICRQQAPVRALAQALVQAPVAALLQALVRLLRRMFGHLSRRLLRRMFCPAQAC
jgi:hypothetical protein